MPDQWWSRSWWPLGAVLAALGPLLPRLGPLPGPPGPLLGVILASWRSLFRALGEFFLEAGPGAFKNLVFFELFSVFYAVLILFLIISCLPRGDPGGQANLENHKNPLCFQWICLGALFAPSAKRTNFRAPAHEILQEKQVQTQPPHRAQKSFKKHGFWNPKWLQHRATINPGGLSERRPKTHPTAANRDQSPPWSGVFA